MRPLLAAIALLAVQPAAGDEPATILCIGDSITAGGKGFPSYRWFLAPLLENAELKVSFIGPHRDQAGGHFGNGGRNTAWLKEQTAKVYARHPADFVLIHSGHNSFSKDQPVPGILRDTEAMIRSIARLNPQCCILLAQVIESGKLPKYGYLPELNRSLPKLAAKLRQQGIPVTTVNLAQHFDWKTDALADKVHPNEAGARKMAQCWFNALAPALRPNQGQKRGSPDGLPLE